MKGGLVAQTLAGRQIVEGVAPFRRSRDEALDPCSQRVAEMGWRVEAGFSRYGFSAAMRSNTEEGLELALRALPPGMSPTSSPVVDVVYSLRTPERRRRGVRETFLVYCDGGLVARTQGAEGAMAALEDELHLRYALNASERVFVHAGVVAIGGQTLLLPGFSLSGKSTLVDALVRSGATYLSDEYAVVRSDGKVEPFPRPIRLRGAGRRTPTADEAGVDTSMRALEVGWVLFTGFEEGGRWYPSRVTRARGAAKLLEHTVAARLKPEASLKAVTEIGVSAEFWESPRNEADAAAGAILNHMCR